ALLFGFVGREKASGQCEYCQQPNLCYVLTFDLPDCPGIQAVICYTCAVTHLEAYFDIHLRNVCHGLESEAYDYARDWVLNNYAMLCGSTPCNEEHARLTFTRPICGRVEYVNGRLNIYKGEGNCYLQCIEVWDWCWCNCVPGECWDGDCPNPHVKWEIVSFTTEGDGTCGKLPYPPSRDCTFINWRPCGKK
ncbi:MAG: hypothetical protein ACK4SO_04300, partial [Candidatus Kapaibacteriota bacterium]